MTPTGTGAGSASAASSSVPMPITAAASEIFSQRHGPGIDHTPLQKDNPGTAHGRASNQTGFAPKLPATAERRRRTSHRNGPRTIAEYSQFAEGLTARTHGSAGPARLP
jgi:hypothetical protein